MFSNQTAILIICLTVRLGHTLDLILLLDGVRVTGSSCGIDQLLGQALSHCLQVPEASLPGTSGQKVKGVVHPAEGEHVNSLTTDDTSTSNTGGILTGSTVDDGINNNLHRVLVSEQVDDLKGVLNNPHSHKLLSAVVSLAHKAACQTLNDGARSLAESLLLVASGSVGKVGGVVTLDGDVIHEGDVTD
eukprot:858638_1